MAVSRRAGAQLMVGTALAFIALYVFMDPSDAGPVARHDGGLDTARIRRGGGGAGGAGQPVRDAEDEEDQEAAGDGGDEEGDGQSAAGDSAEDDTPPGDEDEDEDEAAPPSPSSAATRSKSPAGTPPGSPAGTPSKSPAASPSKPAPPPSPSAAATPSPAAPAPASGSGSPAWRAIADREAGALRRLAAVLAPAPLKAAYKGARAPPGWDALGHDFPRNAILADFADWLPRALGGTDFSAAAGKRLLSTFSRDPELAYLPLPSMSPSYCEYDDNAVDHRVCDLHVMAHEHKGAFDLIIVSQTLEHLLDPVQVARNMLAHLAPGGLFFTSLPVFNRPHSVPVHMAHWTPAGLVSLLESVGFVVERVGAWGAPSYVTKVLESTTWPDYREYSLPDFNSDLDVPVQVWALARRPAGALPPPAAHYPPGRFDEPWFPTTQLVALFREHLTAPHAPPAGDVHALLTAVAPPLARADFVAALVVAVARARAPAPGAVVSYWGATAAEGFTAAAGAAAGLGIAPAAAASPLEPAPGARLVVLTDVLPVVVDGLTTLRAVRASLTAGGACTPLLLAERAYTRLASADKMGHPRSSIQPALLLSDLTRAGFSVTAAGWWGAGEAGRRYAADVLLRGEHASAEALLRGDVSLAGVTALLQPAPIENWSDLLHTSAVAWVLANPCGGVTTTK